MPLLAPTLLAAASASVACPYASFESFARQFLDDVALQRRFTSAQVVRTHIEDAEPEPKSVVEKRPFDDSAFPVAPGASERGRLGLAGPAIDSKASQVVLRSADGDSFQLRLTFRRTDCWRLVRIDDEAL